VNEERENPEQNSLKGNRVDDRANPAHAQGNEVESQDYDQQGVEKLEHWFTSPAR
jgi:hypothetical protein